ncbi:MAG: hypothetical protein ABWY11_01655 [Umezawaea sp.]
MGAAEAVESAASDTRQAEAAVEAASDRVRHFGPPAGLHDSAARHLPTCDVAALRAAFERAEQDVTQSAETLAGWQADQVEATEQQ